jgi:surface polysaccharide O-acyltransferase-like enzyme
MRSADVLSREVGEDPAQAARVPEPETAVQADAPKGPARAQRLANVERLRLVAMFEIVAFHVSGAFGANSRLPVVAGLGLPTFLLLNNAFNCTLAERMGSRAFMQVKVSRLLVPWLVWSVIYALVGMLERLRHGEPLTEGFSPWMIVGGTYDHLWFVPFALFGSVLIVGLQEKTRVWAAPSVASAGLVVGALVLAACALVLATQPIDWPALQWLFALPSPLLGFALGRAVLASDGKLLRRLALLLTPLAVGVAVASYVEPEIEMLRRYLVSLAVVTLAFIWPGAEDRFSRRLAPLLFGIYLIHPLFVRIYQASHLPDLPLIILTAMVFGLSAATVALLQRTKLRQLV